MFSKIKNGDTTLKGHTVSLRKNAFSKNRKDTSLFIAKSWHSVPPVSSISYVYVRNGINCQDFGMRNGIVFIIWE